MYQLQDNLSGFFFHFRVESALALMYLFFHMLFVRTHPTVFRFIPFLPVLIQVPLGLSRNYSIVQGRVPHMWFLQIRQSIYWS